MERIGKYEVKEKLLTTGFSDIFIATDPDLECTVAVKVFHPKGDNVGEKAQYGPDFWRARFIEEAKLLARFDHPNIVTVKTMGETSDGEPFFVMPFLEANLLYEIGEDAKNAKKVGDLLPKWRPRPIAPRRATDVWRQVLDALSAIHVAGLVHRDIKPPNVLLTSKVNGRVKLCDFGMVKVPDARGSRTGIWIGTLDYISPEQRKSAAEVDSRSDVYSAGVLMYRMLSSRLPTDVRAPLRGGRFGIPQALADLIDDCLRKHLRDRPAVAGDVLARLDEIVPVISALPDVSKIPARAAATKIIRGKVP